ncbi:hypothetical protein IYX23_05320 [Methylocystis sp. L43]|uniref:hypothetical protein n=1 Tax=unclassified Methylocystis TaxID=2625913 RepID=UPI0018C32749|nr:MULTISPECIES: hypothetical protein [unclassified Methylocystis]MBG0797106.1 hypothetical protein [Methylocystis sp. L43]MBG0805023.1 hypothetical protein [Methylocystis sp. H15]
MRDVLMSPEAKGRTNLAVKLLVNSPLSASAIVDMLADTPRDGARAFFQVMQVEGSIGISSPIGAATNDDPKAARIEECKRAGTQHALARGYISAEQAKARSVNVGA